jgi:tRNA1Val (adenine37-N6)-methyltransferase
MKVNTDGVLLGALVTAKDPQTILDIGTGTGVIALMLAQRFPAAVLDAVEIDNNAAQTAKHNFHNSPFSNRCICYPQSFEQYFADHPDKKYDLIISNPPFFINSLKSAEKSKQVARHTSLDFFNELFIHSKRTLTPNGRVSLILPIETADAVKAKATVHGMFIQEEISIASFFDSLPHRVVISFGKDKSDLYSNSVVIYSRPAVYTDQYALLLKEFLTIF